MNEANKNLLRELIQAIEHIKLPMMLKQEQADVYNDLILKVETVRIRFRL